MPDRLSNDSELLAGFSRLFRRVWRSQFGVLHQIWSFAELQPTRPEQASLIALYLAAIAILHGGGQVLSQLIEQGRGATQPHAS